MNIRSLTGAALMALPLLVAAQGYPAAPVRIIVPYPPGGGADILIRAIAQELAKKWPQPVVIDNKAGAGGIIGTQAAAVARPDGETLLATIDSPLTANRFLYKRLPYDPDKSFEPVILLPRNYNFIIASPSFPAKNLREVVEIAKRSPAGLNYGSYGVGSHPHLVFSMLAQREHVNLVHVPYKGIAPMTAALIANEVPLATGTVATVGEQMKAGTIKALAYAGSQRSPDFPKVPTTAEMGFPYLVMPIQMALFAPAGTPEAIVRKINADVQAILANPEFAQTQVVARGQQVAGGSPADLAKAMRDTTTLMGEMTRSAGMTPE